VLNLFGVQNGDSIAVRNAHGLPTNFVGVDGGGEGQEKNGEGQASYQWLPLHPLAPHHFMRWPDFCIHVGHDPRPNILDRIIHENTTARYAYTDEIR